MSTRKVLPVGEWFNIPAAGVSCRTHIRFDRDGRMYEELPYFDW